MAPSKLNFKIYQGSTFSETLRWESATKVYVPITNITKTAPMVVTATAHGAPPNWRTKISGVQGMKEANTADYVLVTGVSANTLTYNSVNALNYTAYTSGGVLEYNQPVDLSQYTARMQIREKVSSTTVIKELTTQNSGIVIDNTAKTITLKISAADTAQFTFKSAVYSLELVNADVVVPFIYGNLTLEVEVTR
jgi:tRNA threonylcarbamoyladenosine modification (KEOPS) complex  Pcc1 subunit